MTGSPIFAEKDKIGNRSRARQNDYNFAQVFRNAYTKRVRRPRRVYYDYIIRYNNSYYYHDIYSGSIGLYSSRHAILCLV